MRRIALLLPDRGPASAARRARKAFPTAPVRILVPFAAGGPTDVVARILAELLTARWGGKSVVVENRPGAGTIVATAAVAKAPPDGHTVLIGTNSLLINPAIDQKLPYDTYRDLAGVSMIATQPVALVANKAFPASTIPELVAEAKKQRGPLNFASPGPRGVGHLAGEMLKQRAGIDMTHINYNGSAPALDRRDRRARADHVRRLAFGQALRRFRRAEADRRRRRRSASPTRRRCRPSPRPIRAST